MRRKANKTRRGFWAWLMGREPRKPSQPVPGDAAEAEAAPPADKLASAGATPDLTESPCSVCGGTSFRWGWLESGLYGAGKGPAAARQPKYVKQKTRFGEFLGLRARVCDGCGHVAIFALREDQEQ